MFLKPSIDKLSDDELIDRYRKQKDNRFLGELFGRYIRFVFLVCMKYLKNEELAKDMSMQVFEKVMSDLYRFDIENFKSWLHVVTKNACLMHIRSNKHHLLTNIEEKNAAIKNMEFLAFEHHNKEEYELRLDQLEKAMSILDDNQKQCIDLFYLKEKSYKEVADITGCSMNQVKSYIQNGKRNLKQHLISKGKFLSLVFIYLYFNI